MSVFKIPMARLRRVAMAWGPLPVRIQAASWAGVAWWASRRVMA